MLYQYINSGEATSKHDNSVLQVMDNKIHTVPKKPSEVPNEAVWVGGADGGVWVEVGKLESRRAHLKIFEDFKGAVLADGWFVFSSGCAIDDINKMKRAFGAYDGERIILRKDRIKNPGIVCSMDLSR